MLRVNLKENMSTYERLVMPHVFSDVLKQNMFILLATVTLMSNSSSNVNCRRKICLHEVSLFTATRCNNHNRSLLWLCFNVRKATKPDRFTYAIQLFDNPIIVNTQCA